MRVVLIKHGKTQYNLDGKRQGRTDLNLLEESKQKIKNIRVELESLSFDQIYSSPLKRAIQTAEILFPDKELVIDNLLIEYDFGELEGVPFSSSVEDFPNNETIEYNGITFLLPNRGETFDDIVTRSKNFLERLREKHKPDSTIGIVTHSTNMEILKALIEEKEWHTYLGEARAFHKFVELRYEY